MKEILFTITIQGNTLHDNHPNVSFNGVLVSQRPGAGKGKVQLKPVYPGKLLN
jgi:hypothetical protein